jgi:DNA-binding response OmpR family regulator
LKDTQTRQQAQEAGANAFIVKPLDFNILLEQVRHLTKYDKQFATWPPLAKAYAWLDIRVAHNRHHLND